MRCGCRAISTWFLLKSWCPSSSTAENVNLKAPWPLQSQLTFAVNLEMSPELTRSPTGRHWSSPSHPNPRPGPTPPPSKPPPNPRPLAITEWTGPRGTGVVIHGVQLHCIGESLDEDEMRGIVPCPKKVGMPGLGGAGEMVGSVFVLVVFRSILPRRRGSGLRNRGFCECRRKVFKC